MLETARRLIDRFGALPAAERAVLCRSWCVAVAFRVGLALAGFPRMRAFAVNARPAQRTASIRRIPPARIADLLSAACRWGVPGSTCLTRSLALMWLLGKAGIPAQLCFGARVRDQGLEAHAWVECAGLPMNDSPDHVLEFPRFRGTPNIL